jgi:arsenite methyltransferase
VGHENSLNVEDWCSCIGGALTKENCVDVIKEAGFAKVEIVDKILYIKMEGIVDVDVDVDGRKITILVIKATKQYKIR